MIPLHIQVVPFRMPRLFLLSPASASGKRAALLANPAADFSLARRLRSGEGAPIGEVFSFLSGLYFRGKLRYAERFAADPAGILVITSDRGLMRSDHYVTLADIAAMSAGSIDAAHDPYRTPLQQDARALRASIDPAAEVVLLGSIATDKYVRILAEVFGDRLVFPVDFVGRGDMSRGGLLLRCASEGRQLDYAPVMTAVRRGSRPAKLTAPSVAKASARRASAVRPRNDVAALPLPLDYAPMEARPAEEIPVGKAWQYEPKWDGFRCVAFREGGDVVLMSKAGKPLTRYFPELVAALAALPAARFVLDGEIAVTDGKQLDFNQLLQRIHPAASRIRKLGAEHPATCLLFDLLVDADGNDLTEQPLDVRRAALESFAKATRIIGRGTSARAVRLSPATTSLTTVRRWFTSVGRGLDGIIAKRRDMSYQSGLRTGMVKVKHKWTADCVVGGFRYDAKGSDVGSLLLGLYNAQGKLDHVGFLSGIKAAERTALTARLEKLVKSPGFTGSAPGGPSRWSTERSTEWQPLAPKLVVEVQYDHFSGGRFRHGTRFVRWRPDKAPRQCTVEQLPAAKGSVLTLLE